MSRTVADVTRSLAVVVLLASGTARAADPPAGEDAARSVEDRLREVEAANAALADKVRILQHMLEAPKIVPPPPPPPPSPPAAAAPTASEPFAWGDFTWMNGASRQTEHVLDNQYFTPQFDVDLNYTYSFNRPIDHTIVGSTATFRHNELELAFLGIGGDAHIGPVRGRVFFQFGERAVGVPRNDVTINHGQYDLGTAMRYLSEAYAGYHWNKYHGINLDVGLFFSYVGLFSYTQYENWGYQASFTSDNTPWFFNGARLQIFPTDRLKVELWLINGWQTYGKFNELPGVGYQIRFAPREWLNTVFNGYVGTDTQDHPGRVRFHSDNSLLLRYYNHPRSKGVSRGAIAVTFDIGFEQGDGVGAFYGQSKSSNSAPDLNCTNANPCQQDFVSGMAYNNLWFYRNTFSWYVGGGFIHNPGRYLVLVPAGVAAQTFDTNPGTTFDGWDLSTKHQLLPDREHHLPARKLVPLGERALLLGPRRRHRARRLQVRRPLQPRRHGEHLHSRRLDARPRRSRREGDLRRSVPHVTAPRARKETTMTRIFAVSAIVLLLGACQPKEGERCNPLLFTDECETGSACTYPPNCGVAYCCPKTGTSSHPNCQPCPAADGGAGD